MEMLLLVRLVQDVSIAHAFAMKFKCNQHDFACDSIITGWMFCFIVSMYVTSIECVFLLVPFAHKNAAARSCYRLLAEQQLQVLFADLFVCAYTWCVDESTRSQAMGCILSDLASAQGIVKRLFPETNCVPLCNERRGTTGQAGHQ